MICCPSQKDWIANLWSRILRWVSLCYKDDFCRHWMQIQECRKFSIAKYIKLSIIIYKFWIRHQIFCRGRHSVWVRGVRKRRTFGHFHEWDPLVSKCIRHLSSRWKQKLKVKLYVVEKKNKNKMLDHLQACLLSMWMNIILISYSLTIK